MAPWSQVSKGSISQFHSGSKHVCIIGAGPAGLCSLRQCLREAGAVSATVFEQQNNIGGVWNYNGPEVRLWDVSGNPVIFPMYSGLQCNLPKELMQFQDFKVDHNDNSFPSQKDMRSYLLQYADHFQMWPYIQFNSRVVNVKPLALEELGTCRWMVTIENTRTFQWTTNIFDAVMCCVGVNFYPKYPVLEGLDTFRGHVFHSKYFKTVTQNFVNQSVVLVGLGPTCADLCLKLAPVCKQVVACHRYPGGFSLGLLPENCRETGTVKRLTESSVITESGEDIPCNILILCTGYIPVFPFLEENDMMTPDSNDKRAAYPGSRSNLVEHLYKKIFVPRHPSFGFINGHGLVAEFLVMEIQARYFVAVVQARVHLPESAATMEKAAPPFPANQGKLTDETLKGNKFALKDIQDYLEGLSKEAGFFPDFQQIPLQLAVWQWTIKRIFGKLAASKKDELKALSETKWEYKCAPDNPAGNSFTKIFQMKDDGTVTSKSKKSRID